MINRLPIMKALITASLSIGLVACGVAESNQSSDNIRANQVERLQREAARQVPTPSISNFQQLRWQSYLYELQDNAISTFSYTTTLDGSLIYLCPSVGYGMNASIQITNPNKVISASLDDADGERNFTGHYNYTGPINQPEPNGLYMPEGLESTYVMCQDRNGDGEPDPLYVESEVLVSLVQLPHDKSWWRN